MVFLDIDGTAGINWLPVGEIINEQCAPTDSWKPSGEQWKCK